MSAQTDWLKRVDAVLDDFGIAAGKMTKAICDPDNPKTFEDVEQELVEAVRAAEAALTAARNEWALGLVGEDEDPDSLYGPTQGANDLRAELRQAIKGEAAPVCASCGEPGKRYIGYAVCGEHLAELKAWLDAKRLGGQS